MNPERQFQDECKAEIEDMARNEELKSLSLAWMRKAQSNKYSYHFTWLGRPVIQYPQDIVAMQEIIWKVQPDLIIETGVAHGGSLIFSASMLELNAACGGCSDARVLGIDIDIRAHNRAALEAHPMFKRISLMQGSSIAADMVEAVRKFAAPYKNILVFLDSNHTHDHVLAELEAYAPLVSKGSFCVVFDTIIENFSEQEIGDRPWAQGNSPMSAVDFFLKSHPEFTIDREIDAKLLISVAPRGYLYRK